MRSLRSTTARTRTIKRHCGYRFAPTLTEQFFKDIRESANLLVSAVELYKDIDYFLRTGTKMSFTDVTLVRLAKEIHASLFTFDRQMLALFRRSA